MTVVKSRRAANALAKACVSAVLAALLFRHADVRETLRAVLRLGPAVWVSGVLLYAAGQVISAYRWKLLSAAAGFRVPLRDHVSYYFIGMFFNLFLPTSVGGDAVKCWYLSRADPSGRAAPAVYTVLAERATGFLVMVWMGTAALLVARPAAVPGAAAVSAVACSAASMLLLPFVPSLAGPLARRRAWARTALEDVSVYWRSPGAVLRALAWSLLFHSLLVVIHLLIGAALGLAVPAAWYAVAYSSASLAGFLPVSLSGIGPREATYLSFLTLAGAGRPEALAFGVCWLGIIVFASLPGGVVYLAGGRRAERGGTPA